MTIWKSFLNLMPCRNEFNDEVEKLINELVTIARQDDFLSEHPGGRYNAQCRHIRTRQIGERLHSIGGLELMLWVFRKISKRSGSVSASHLEYAWTDIGDWQH